MRVFGVVFVSAVTAVSACAITLASTPNANAQTKLTMGKVVGGDGFHIPTYVALDQGFFKAEGLDASLVELPANAIVTAVLSGNLDCAPIPSGGAQAALSGAKIVYIVGESLKSQWTVTTRQDIAKPENLKGKTIGLGRPGGADYDEAQAVLHRFYQMDSGRDYKVISFQGEADRVGALVNGDIQGALISVPHAARAVAAGMKVLLRTGDYVARAGGTIWAPKAYVDGNPETVKKFIRAIARAVMYFRNDKAGSLATLKEHLSIDNAQEAGLVWDELHNAFGAELPPELFREILESRRETMIAARQWPADKPLPDPEQFVARKLLDSTLQEMGYTPTKVDAPTR